MIDCDQLSWTVLTQSGILEELPAKLADTSQEFAFDPSNISS